MKIVGLAALCLLTSGCFFFGACGPMAGSVEARSVLAAEFSDANKTRLRDALEADGFTVTDELGDLHAVRGDVSAWVQPTYQANTTDVRIHITFPSREFKDNAAGYDKARHYIDDEAARLQPEATRLYVRLADALQVSPGTAPLLEGNISIC